MSAEKKLRELQIILPKSIPPAANYIPIKRVGNLLYISGQAAFKDGKLVHAGKLGEEVTVEEGYYAARIAAINILSILKEYLGDLDQVKNVVKVNGYIASAPDFYMQPKVLNGASDLLADVFTGCGNHARTAIGQVVLPFNTPVEVEAIFEV